MPKSKALHRALVHIRSICEEQEQVLHSILKQGARAAVKLPEGLARRQALHLLLDQRHSPLQVLAELEQKRNCRVTQVLPRREHTDVEQ